jgi:hypothetical protein
MVAAEVPEAAFRDRHTAFKGFQDFERRDVRRIA